MNVINPATGQRPLPALDQVDVRGEDGVGNFHGLISSLQVNSFKGLLLRANYMWSHSINDGSSGGGGSDGAPQNVACRACDKGNSSICDKGNSSIDVRNVFTTNFAYEIPVAKRKWCGGWEWSGIANARSGLPLNVTITRVANTVLDGNTLSAERPNLVPGVPVYLDYGATGRWLNSAAFAIPAAGVWGNLGRNVFRAPRLFQIDTALMKQTRLTERMGLADRTPNLQYHEPPSALDCPLRISALPPTSAKSQRP